MLKANLFICLLSIVTFSPILCMISQFQCQPYTQASSDKTTKTRDRITEWVGSPTTINIGIITKDIIVIRQTTPQEQLCTCFGYAIAQATGTTVPLTLYENIGNRTSTINIEKFFEQTEHPQKNGLVIYTTDKDNRTINHVGFIIDQKTFESKWGFFTNIIQHSLFSIPTFYGNTASFWALKKEFRSSEGKEILLKNIRNDALIFNKALHHKTMIRTMLIMSTTIFILSRLIMSFIAHP